MDGHPPAQVRGSFPADVAEKRENSAPQSTVSGH
jgi:hypothetical protein